MDRKKIVLLTIAFAAVGCGGSNAITTINGVFLGTTSDNAEDIAIVADAPLNGSTRAMTVYVSDGNSVSELFTGDVNGNIFDLSNAEARVSGTIDSFGASGNLTLPASSPTYTATTQGEPAGLYTVTVDMLNGTVVGTSTRGSHLSATIGTTLIGNDFEVTGTVTPTGGAAQNITALLSQDSDGEQDWIVMPDLSIRGGGILSGQGSVTSG